MSLERQQLAVLVALDRYGSVTAAAAALNITQSAASQRLREAERRLAIPLTTKRGRSVAMTSAARHLVEAAEQAERMLSTAESEAQWLARAAAPSIRVLVSVFDSIDAIVPLCGLLESRKLAVEVIRTGPSTAGSVLGDGGADVFVTPTRRVPAGCSSVALTTDELVAVGAPDDWLAASTVVAPPSFEGRTYITYSDRPEAGFEYEQFFAPAGVLPADVRRIESSTTILDLVAAGLGVTILPAITTRAHQRAGRVVIRRLASPAPIEWSLAGHPPRSGNPTLPELADLFRVALRR